jgi:signal transduction histidine kinase
MRFDGERMAAAAGLVASLTVGVPVLLVQLRGDPSPVIGPSWLWWASYLGYLAAFVANEAWAPDGRWERRLLGVQVLLGAMAVALTPRMGLSAVLLVVTAVTAAYVLPPRGAVVVAVANTGLIAAVALVDGFRVDEAILGALIYGSLQCFALLMVFSGQRELAAKQRLAGANAELRAATALLEEQSRAGERLRIARDLHDLVGHQLTALALELEVASHRATPPVSEHVSRARRIAKDLLTDVRGAVSELRNTSPPLHAALESLTVGLTRPRVHLDIDDTLELDGVQTTALVRCAQEIVTNAVRHADADNLWIEVGRSDQGAIFLRAYDDGLGASSLRLGNGLTGMRERIEQLGGTVDFNANPGFRIQAEVPAP